MILIRTVRMVTEVDGHDAAGHRSVQRDKGTCMDIFAMVYSAPAIQRLYLLTSVPLRKR